MLFSEKQVLYYGNETVKGIAGNVPTGMTLSAMSDKE
jgi:hypothetical protein